MRKKKENVVANKPTKQLNIVTLPLSSNAARQKCGQENSEKKKKKLLHWKEVEEGVVLD